MRGLLPRISVPAFEIDVDGRRIPVPYSTPAERRAAVHLVSRVIKSHSRPTRDRTLEQLRRLAGDPHLGSPMLTWAELGDMARLGMTIGGHTLTHANLPSAGLIDATDEITACKRRLERELGLEVTQFSYPNGGAERYYTPEIKKAVMEAGYAAASTSENGFTRTGSDLFALERVQVAEALSDLVFALEIERFAFAPAARRAAGTVEAR
jgi:peptidoglycan/xylan/chitin deacetylase (PgdA/CDA1 family)